MTGMTDTRDQIMERAAELLMKRGFNGFSYRDISSHLGVKNAAVHYHFPAKVDLALALVEEYRQTLRRETSGFMAYGGSAREQLEGFMAFATNQCHAGRCVCPIGAFSIDYSEFPENVRAATASFMAETIKWLTQVLEVGREQEEFSFSGQARPKALSIMAALQGARQMVRIGDIEILTEICAQLRKDLSIDA